MTDQEEKEGGKNPRIKMPEFSGKLEEYEEWRTRIKEWSLMESGFYEYPGLMVKSSLKEEAWRCVDTIEMSEIIKRDSLETILKKLDERYKRDSRIISMNKILEFYDIERKSEETIREFFDRFERVRRECMRIEGQESQELTDGWLALKWAKLSEMETQIVLGACVEGRQGYENEKNEVIRIVEKEKTVSEKTYWLTETRDEKNKGSPTQRLNNKVRCYRCGELNHLATECKETENLCWICKMKGHIARECPKRWKNRATNSETKVALSKGWVGDSTGSVTKENSVWGEVEAIIDTGCPRTIIGEK